MSFLRSAGAAEVDPSKLGIDDEMLDLLYELGMFGCVRSYFVHAQAIFDGYKAMKPKSERVHIGLGLLALSRADYDKALTVFKDELLKINPDNPFGKAYLGLTYKSSPPPAG